MNTFTQSIHKILKKASKNGVDMIQLKDEVVTLFDEFVSSSQLNSEPPKSTRCNALTKKGSQCKKNAISNALYCNVHKFYVSVEEKAIVNDDQTVSQENVSDIRVMPPRVCKNQPSKQNRVVEDKVKCEALTKKGTRCTRYAVFKKVCKIHRDVEEVIPVQESKNDDGGCSNISKYGNKCISRAIPGKQRCAHHELEYKKENKAPEKSAEEGSSFHIFQNNSPQCYQQKVHQPPSDLTDPNVIQVVNEPITCCEMFPGTDAWDNGIYKVYPNEEWFSDEKFYVHEIINKPRNFFEHFPDYRKEPQRFINLVKLIRDDLKLMFTSFSYHSLTREQFRDFGDCLLSRVGVWDPNEPVQQLRLFPDYLKERIRDILVEYVNTESLEKPSGAWKNPEWQIEERRTFFALSVQEFSGEKLVSLVLQDEGPLQSHAIVFDPLCGPSMEVSMYTLYNIAVSNCCKNSDETLGVLQQLWPNAGPLITLWRNRYIVPRVGGGVTLWPVRKINRGFKDTDNVYFIRERNHAACPKELVEAQNFALWAYNRDVIVAVAHSEFYRNEEFVDIDDWTDVEYLQENGIPYLMYAKTRNACYQFGVNWSLQPTPDKIPKMEPAVNQYWVNKYLNELDETHPIHTMNPDLYEASQNAVVMYNITELKSTDVKGVYSYDMGSDFNRVTLLDLTDEMGHMGGVFGRRLVAIRFRDNQILKGDTDLIRIIRSHGFSVVFLFDRLCEKFPHLKACEEGNEEVTFVCEAPCTPESEKSFSIENGRDTLIMLQKLDAAEREKNPELTKQHEIAKTLTPAKRLQFPYLTNDEYVQNIMRENAERERNIKYRLRPRDRKPRKIFGDVSEGIDRDKIFGTESGYTSNRKGPFNIQEILGRQNPQ